MLSDGSQSGINVIRNAVLQEVCWDLLPRVLPNVVVDAWIAWRGGSSKPSVLSAKVASIPFTAAGKCYEVREIGWLSCLVCPSTSASIEPLRDATILQRELNVHA